MVVVVVVVVVVVQRPNRRRPRRRRLGAATHETGPAGQCPGAGGVYRVGVTTGRAC